jgi:hypothetical protein
MSMLRAIVGLGGTIVIAAWVAYAVSAPRTADDFMNQEMASLDGKSINETVAEARADANAMQCETYRRLAQEQWDKSVTNGTTDRDADKLDEIDRQVDRFCN